MDGAPLCPLRPFPLYIILWELSLRPYWDLRYPHDPSTVLGYGHLYNNKP